MNSFAPQSTDPILLIKPDQTADWADFFDRMSIIRHANYIIDDLILEIHRRNLDIYKNMDAKEFALLYRFPIHVGVNIFIERLLRVAYTKEMNWSRSYPEVSYQPRYFKDTNEAVPAHYVDFAINHNLLHQIYRILGGPTQPGQESGLGMEQPRPQDALLYKPLSILDRTKKTLKTLIEFYVKLSKPEVVGEYSNWMREIFSFRQMLSFSNPVCNFPIDSKTRTAITDCCNITFSRHVGGILNRLDTGQNQKLSSLFAEFIDHIIPQAIVEELTERFSYYEMLTKKWNLRQVHSFIGYYYSENYKIFAILARRKGALLIGHAHGASNPRPVYRHICNELAFVDYYFTWGNQDGLWMTGDKAPPHLKIIGLGSTYLAKMPKWNKTKIDPEEMILLYPSGPLVDFMTDLEETATREKTFKHRLELLAFLKSLRVYYPGMKILYKPFPGTYTQDPIKDVFRKELEAEEVQVVDVKPSTLYDKVDIVLWDNISTGFSESIQSGVPTLVFQFSNEYDWASSLGKELNEDLMRCGMIVRDAEAGYLSVSRMVNRLTDFLDSREEVVRRFQSAVAYPVSKPEFLRRSRAALNGRNR